MQVEIIVLRSDKKARSIYSYTRIPSSDSSLREYESETYDAVVNAFQAQCDLCILIVSNESTMQKALAAIKVDKIAELIKLKHLCHIVLRSIEGVSVSDELRQPCLPHLEQFGNALVDKVITNAQADKVNIIDCTIQIHS